MSKVEIISKETVFEDFFKIESAIVKYQRFDGHMSKPVRRLNFVRGDSVAAVIYDERRDLVILVNQFKYPTYSHGSGWITELAAGMVSDSEDPESSIRREILEETGYQVKSLEHLTTFYVSPGGTSERIWLYLALVDSDSKISDGGGVPSEEEDINIIEMSLSDAWQAVKDGGIADAKTILGLMWLSTSRGQSWKP